MATAIRRNYLSEHLRDSLWQSEDSYRELIDMLPDTIIRCDSRGFIQWISSNCSSLLRYKPAELVGCDIVVLMPETIRMHAPRSFRSYIEAGQREHDSNLLDADVLRRDGTLVRVGMSYKEKWGGGFVVIMRDITSRVTQEKSLIASEKIAMLGRLTSGIMHEINNPLDAIGMNLYLLRSLSTSPEQLTYLDRAEEMLGRVVTISRNTLSFSRSSSSDNQLSMKDVVSSVVDLFAERLKKMDITVHLVLQTEGRIYGNVGELRQVCANVIRNAIDACGKGGSISIRLYDSVGRGATVQPFGGVRLVVADSGGGITQEAKRRLGQPFYTTKGDEGTGLGMWITTQIVEKHGGTMRVRNQFGELHGAVFSVFLPHRTSILQVA